MLEKLNIQNSMDFHTWLFFKIVHHYVLSLNRILRREQFLQWTEALPDAQSPSWLGLPNNAEKVLLTTQG